VGTEIVERAPNRATRVYLRLNAAVAAELECHGVEEPQVQDNVVTDNCVAPGMETTHSANFFVPIVFETGQYSVLIRRSHHEGWGEADILAEVLQDQYPPT
jgi:hypothetical protein